MADRVKFILQKRTALKSQITGLANLFEKGTADNTALKLRLNRLTVLYNAFEEYNDELAILDPDDVHQTEFSQIQERFYSLASKIENFLNTTGLANASTSSVSSGNPSDNSVPTANKRRMKLPDAPLPTFNGKYENWLSFKNAFHDRIGSQADLSDIDKLHYLKSALTDDAASKINVLSVDGINYAKAWSLLERSYEVKRILISRHLSKILNLPILERESTSGLTKLADDTQQHLASLSALGVSVGSEMVVHILETKLPKHTIDKWEIGLERDEVPTLDQLYEFLYKTAVSASKRERAKSSDSERNKSEPPIKRRKFQSANQAFVANTTPNCAACKIKRHPIYLCDAFKKLTVQKRIDLVKKARLCYICLRSHNNKPCKFMNCTICNKRHNSLLHIENYTPIHKSDTTQSVIVKKD
ncbi:hypothetical protein PUN28_012882 [Cardiocondyla obscurior]|uniref:Gag-pol polyprotein n=1 Tax=Cardiocondyla obscurior TaxID=286306 RepID=A0AAW2F8R0_9HYME